MPAKPTASTAERRETVRRILALLTHHDFPLLLKRAQLAKDPLQTLLDMVDGGSTDPYKVGMLLGEIRAAQRLRSLADRLRKELARLDALPANRKEK